MIIISENGNVRYENEPDVDRQLLPNGTINVVTPEIVADKYSPETSYSEGDVVFYEGKLYQADTSTTGTFDEDDWTEVTVAELITAAGSGDPDAIYRRLIAAEYSSSSTYAVGDYCINNNYLYRCTTAISTAEAWTSGHWQQVTVGTELSDLKSDLKLLCDEIPDTTQTYTFANGAVSQVTHSRNGTTIRTDAFTYGTSTITEVRTLNTGESLTIVTNLTTLETTVTYSAA